MSGVTGDFAALKAQQAKLKKLQTAIRDIAARAAPRIESVAGNATVKATKDSIVVTSAIKRQRWTPSDGPTIPPRWEHELVAVTDEVMHSCGAERA